MDGQQVSCSTVTKSKTALSTVSFKHLSPAFRRQKRLSIWRSKLGVLIHTINSSSQIMMFILSYHCHRTALTMNNDAIVIQESILPNKYRDRRLISHSLAPISPHFSWPTSRTHQSRHSLSFCTENRSTIATVWLLSQKSRMILQDNFTQRTQVP